MTEQNRAVPPESARLVALGQAVIDTEAAAVLALRGRIGDAFVVACRHLLACVGRIVVLGMGKSGHIGGKIAATLASTGSPAFFVHPGEASHGDLGMIVPGDVVLAISNSGETEELLTILPLIRRLEIPLITLTGNADSTLARAAAVNLDVSVAQEACPLGLAPTSSTTATLVMGDALAVSLLEARGFTAEDFARSHPGGRLGRRLLLLIQDIMHTNEAVPKVSADVVLSEALVEMTRKGLGMTAVVDDDGRLAGIFTDGDLRRVIDRRVDVHTATVGAVMTRSPQRIRAETLAVEAVAILERHRISQLPVVDADDRVIGAFNMHDLLRAGVV